MRGTSNLNGAHGDSRPFAVLRQSWYGFPGGGTGDGARRGHGGARHGGGAGWRSVRANAADGRDRLPRVCALKPPRRVLFCFGLHIVYTLGLVLRPLACGTLSRAARARECARERLSAAVLRGHSLSQMPSLFVKQRVEMLEAFTGFEGANMYASLPHTGCWEIAVLIGLCRVHVQTMKSRYAV